MTTTLSLIQRYVIIADYGDGPTIVSRHTSLNTASCQAEHRFINTNAQSVIVQDSRHLTIAHDQDGRLYEWRRMDG
jgi:hypothetical protein